MSAVIDKNRRCVRRGRAGRGGCRSEGGAREEGSRAGYGEPTRVRSRRPVETHLGDDGGGPPPPPRETSSSVRAFPAAGQRRGGVRSLRVGGGGAPERPTRSFAAFGRAHVLGAPRARRVDRQRAGHVPAVPAPAARRASRRRRDERGERGGTRSRQTRVSRPSPRRRRRRTERARVSDAVRDRASSKFGGSPESAGSVRAVRPR